MYSIYIKMSRIEKKTHNDEEDLFIEIMIGWLTVQWNFVILTFHFAIAFFHFVFQLEGNDCI